MTKIVCHIGDHKTGSTAIQSTLANGSFTVPDTSLVYARTCRPERGIAHFQFSGALEAGRRKAVAKFLAALATEIAQTKPDVIVLSSEGFEGQKPEEMKDALTRGLADVDHELQIIAYVRPHAARILSSFAERVKIGLFTGTLEEFSQRSKRTGRFKYVPRFQGWRDAFGASFVLRPMVRDHLRDRDVVSDFLNIALDGADYSLQAAPSANESLSLQDLAMVRALQDRLRNKDGATVEQRTEIRSMQHNIGRNLAHLLRPNLDGTPSKLKLHQTIADDIATFYEYDAMELDEMFFNGAPMATELRNAPNDALAEPQSLELDALFSLSEQRLLRIWLDLTATMINGMEPAAVSKALQAKGGADEDGDDDGKADDA